MYIHWLWQPPSNRDHQNHYIMSEIPINLHLSLLGGGHTQVYIYIYLYTYIHTHVWFLGGWCKIMDDISQVPCQEPFALAGIVNQCNRSYVIGELSGWWKGDDADDAVLVRGRDRGLGPRKKYESFFQQPFTSFNTRINLYTSPSTWSRNHYLPSF